MDMGCQAYLVLFARQRALGGFLSLSPLPLSAPPLHPSLPPLRSAILGLATTTDAKLRTHLSPHPPHARPLSILPYHSGRLNEVNGVALLDPYVIRSFFWGPHRWKG